MKIQILGTGCPKCKKLYDMTREAAEELHLNAEISKVEKLRDIVAMGVMTTPGLAVDGRVVFSGGLPTAEKLKELLQP